jgi:hypothetical protein
MVPTNTIHYVRSSILAFILLAFPVFGADSSPECRVPADPDTLGLGVRLGLYFQLSSFFLLQLVRVEEALDTVLATGFFFASFFIAVLYSTARGDFTPGAQIACTWYPLLFYLALFSFDGREMDKGQRIRRYGVAHLLWMGSGCLNIWFWFKGLDNEHVDQCMEPRVFFFANLNARGGVRVLYRIFTLAFVIGILALFIFASQRPGNRQPSKGKRDVGSDRDNSVSRGEVAKVLPMSTPTISAQDSDRMPAIADLEKQVGLEVLNVSSNTAGSVAPNDVSETSWSSFPAKQPLPPGQTSASVEPLPPSPIRTPNAAPTTKPDIQSQAAATSPPAVSEPLNTAVPPALPNEGPDKRDWDMTVGAFLFLGLYLVASELQMKWNHLDGIYSVNTTGQILPLALGSLSLFRSLYLLKDANWSRLTKEKVEEKIKKLERRLTLRSIPEAPVEHA